MVGDLFAELCFILTMIGLLIAWRWPSSAELEVTAPSRLSSNGARRRAQKGH